MDGYGYNPDTYGNAIAAAKKPNLDKYMASCPNTIIGASGLDVGLPDGQMGNSDSTITRLSFQQWKAVRQRALRSTLWDFFLPAVYTATWSTFSVS